MHYTALAMFKIAPKLNKHYANSMKLLKLLSVKLLSVQLLSVQLKKKLRRRRRVKLRRRRCATRCKLARLR